MVTWGQRLYGDSQSSSQVHSGTYLYHGRPVQVAIKTLRLSEDQLSSTIQELLIQSMLEDCPYICRLYGYYLAKGQICIISEALGLDLEKDLAQRIAWKTSYTEANLLSMLAEIVEALLYAQRKSIAHRDIKPHNILTTLSPPYHVKLVDFGSGCLVDGKVQQLTGTPLYMSPELIPVFQQYQVTGDLPPSSSDPYQADVYSLGVTFLHLALAEVPVKLMGMQREAALAEYIERLKQDYPIMHSFLVLMLQTDPMARITFEQLRTSLLLLSKNAHEPLINAAQSVFPLQIDHFKGTQLESFTEEQQLEYLQYWANECSLAQPHSLYNLDYIFTSAMHSRFSVFITVKCEQCSGPMQVSDEVLECSVHGLLCAACSQLHDCELSELKCQICANLLSFDPPTGKLSFCEVCYAPVMRKLQLE